VSTPAALRPRCRGGAGRRPRARALQGALAPRRRVRGHDRRHLPRPPLCPGPAAALPHDALLRRLREPSSPPRPGHPIPAAADRADAASAALRDMSPRRPPRGDGDPTPHRLGAPPSASLRRRRDGLLQVRRADEDPRGRHRSQRHRQAPTRRSRTAASLSSWTVGVVRLSPRRNVAVGFARPVVDVASRSPARAVS